MRGWRLLYGHLALVVAMTVLSFAVPGLLAVWRSVIGVTSAAVLLAGVARNRPRRRLPWWMFAAALLVFTVGSVLAVLSTDPPGHLPPLSHVCFLGLFTPLAAGGLLALARTGQVDGDRTGLLDVLILTAATGLLAWTFLIEPFVNLPGLPLGEHALGIAYPVSSVLVFGMLARLASVVRRNPAALLLLVGGLGTLGSGVLYGLSNLGAAISLTEPTNVSWALLHGAWAAAAQHPAMRSLTEPRRVSPVELGPLRLAVFATALLLAPATLAVEVAVGSVPEAVVAAGLTVAIFLLVLSRLTAALEVYRHAVARERVLRRAGAALVGVTRLETVTTTVERAVAELLPPGTPHRVLLEPAAEHASSPAGGDAGEENGPVPAWRLDPELVRRLGNPEAVLRRELVYLRDGGERTHLGRLYIGADKRPLARLRAAVDVLATQTAQALKQIRLVAEIKRRAGEEYFRTLVQNASDVILIVDEDDTVRYASPSARTLLGLDRVTGRSLYELVQPQGRPAVSDLMGRVRAGAEPCPAADWELKGPFGRWLQAEARCRDLRDEPSVAGIVVTLRDVTEQRRLERELAHRAYHDALTGLPNRVLFQERLEQAMATAAERGTVVGVLLLDLDDFKTVNDTLGHAAGDELLVRVSHRLVGRLRAQDTAARLGGDEFGALIDDARDPEDIEQVAERVVAGFAEPFELGGVAVSGSVTVGVATSADAGSARDLQRQADLALYVAKTSGKGQWRRYRPSDHAEVLRRTELRSALSRAVASGAFELEYQPIVALHTGQAVGLEALVRWRHPARGQVAPGEFIDVAEETGLIVPIGSWVLGHAVADAASWSTLGPDPPYLSLNVSARQFRLPGFTTAVQRTLETAGLPPSRLVIEITESTLMRDPVWAELVALRSLGVRVAIDDFGTGYSSLSYLRQLPVDIVKLEKSFLTTITSSASQLAVVEGILALADRLGLVVVAEGVDRPAVRDRLLRSGCRYGQGYLFARPMPLREALAWLHGSAQAA